MKVVKITNEQEAFDFLQKAVDRETDGDISLSFDEWPRLTIKLKGSGYSSTITPSLMEGLLELQNGLYRTYAKIVKDEDSAIYLKKAEKKELEFKAKVSEGSSLINVDLGPFAAKTFADLVGKMDPIHIIVLVLGALVIWTGSSLFKKHLELSSHDKNVSEDTKKSLALSAEETKRMQIFAQAVATDPRLTSVDKDASRAHLDLLKGVSDADSIDMNGISIDQDDALKIAGTKRSKAEEKQINGYYFIRSVDTSHPEEIKIKLFNIEGNKEFYARFKDDSLDKKQISLLQNAEWNRKKIYLSVNATELRGGVTSATIIGVVPQVH